MPDNYVVKDGNGASKTFAAKQIAGPVLVPRSIPTDETGATIAVATSTLQSAQNTLIGAVTETAPASDTASSGLNGRLQRIAQRITSLIALVPASLGQKAMSASFAVVVASDQNAIPVNRAVAAAAALANVASSASSVTLQASNASRRGLLIHNDSSAVLYVKYGATASATSYSVQIAAGQNWEMSEPIYTGIVDGIWSAATGAARVTELT